ncbi:MAG: SCP-like extracellular [Clostridia bacterium]|nr:SCP-like extracellular [Clostridia bacterium]
MIKKRKLVILFAFVLMIILISNIFAITVKSYKPKYGLTTDNVNFRSSTSLVYGSIIKQISKNVNIKMVGETGNFYIVQLASNEVGFISKDYVKTVTNAPNAKVYTSLTPYIATVTATSVNVRRGPSTNFPKVSSLNKGTSVTVIGKIDNFYTVIYGTNKVGMIEASLIKKGTNTTTPTPAPSTPTPTTNLSLADLVLKYINEARAANSLPALTKDWKLADIAQRKSNEMVEKDYFLHTSPTYGTPFDMMKNFGITYKTAGENLAGNSDMKAAVDSWMNSEGHRKNILSNSYNYIGIGVTKSEKYGYVISAMFIGK